MLTIKEIEEINPIHLETSEKEEELEEQAIVLPPNVGEMLVLRRILYTMELPQEENQREHIFHSRCTIQGNVCSLFIDGGSCINVILVHLIYKLRLPTIQHPSPYSLRLVAQERK